MNIKFTDSHGHIAAFGRQISGLKFNNCRSAEECVLEAINFENMRGSWLTGRGWNEELWDRKELPENKILDDAFPDIPVYFSRVDGHAAWANSTALKLAAITNLTPNPFGGKILKDKSGNPTGILLDEAMNLVKKLIPEQTKEQIKENIISGMNELMKYNIDEVHDMDVPIKYIEIYKQLDEQNLLPIKVLAYITAQNGEWLNKDIKPYSGNMFHICGLKFYSDGALGSRGAALLGPYKDLPTSKGLLLIQPEKLYELASLGLQRNLHIATHAIGDAANRMVIDVYEKLRKGFLTANNSILRIEHAQIIHPSDIPRIAKSNIIASVQPIHCVSDMAGMAQQRLTEDVLSYSYPWKSLLEAGIKIIAGSDFPIESCDPQLGMNAFVKRIPFSMTESWREKECISENDAIQAYTNTPHELFKIL